MHRREFTWLVGCAAVAWPVALRAQQAAMPVVGYLGASSRETTGRLVAAFLLSLKEAGFIEGQNVAIEYRWADDQYDRLPAMAAIRFAVRLRRSLRSASLPRWRPRRQRRRYQSLSQPLSIRSRPVSSPVSIAPAAI
jgi:hypothetical protein